MISHRLQLSVPRHLIQLAIAFALVALTISSPVEARSEQPEMPVCPHEPPPPTADLPHGFQSSQWTSFQHYCTARNPGPNCRCLTDHLTGELTVECLPRLGSGMFAHGPVVATNECLMYCSCEPIFWAGIHPPLPIGQVR